MNSIFLIVGCSGSGKTAIVTQLEQKYGLKSIQSYTTRKPRYHNEKGHIFISDEEFDKLEDLVAFTVFCDNKYAATSAQVDTHDLYVIDPNGVSYFQSHYKGHKTAKIIYIKSDVHTRYERMRDRGVKSGLEYTTSVDNALQRIANDSSEFYNYEKEMAHVDFCVLNSKDSHLDEVVDKVYNYIKNNL